MSPIAEPEGREQPFTELNDRDFKALVQSYWNFAGELTRKEFYPRILLLAILSLPSLLLVLIPVLGPIYVLGLTTALAAIVVQRLRHLAKPWWLVFLLVVPVLGWVVLGFLAALKGTKDSDDDGLSLAHGLFNGLAVFVVAVFLSIALVINQESSGDSSSGPSSDSSELSDQAVEGDSQSSSPEPQNPDIGTVDSDEIVEEAEPEEKAPEDTTSKYEQDNSAPQPQPDAGNSVATDRRFSSCTKAKAAGYGPYVQGVDEEYGWYADGDKDGTVCE